MGTLFLPRLLGRLVQGSHGLRLKGPTVSCGANNEVRQHGYGEPVVRLGL